MAVRPTITINAYWDRDEPDGCRCVCCGDQCFLAMWRLILSAKKIFRQKTTPVLCDSCHQAIMES